MKLSALVLIAVLLPSAVASAVPVGLPIIADDYGRARAEATRRRLPLFVDVWAPW